MLGEITPILDCWGKAVEDCWVPVSVGLELVAAMAERARVNLPAKLVSFDRLNLGLLQRYSHLSREKSLRKSPRCSLE